MTDLVGRWDVVVALVILLALAIVALKRRRNRAPRGKDGVTLTTTEQTRALFSAESRLKKRYLKPDGRARYGRAR